MSFESLFLDNITVEVLILGKDLVMFLYLQCDLDNLETTTNFKNIVHITCFPYLGLKINQHKEP